MMRLIGFRLGLVIVVMTMAVPVVPVIVMASVMLMQDFRILEGMTFAGNESQRDSSEQEREEFHDAAFNSFPSRKRNPGS
ncbi:MAG: hypothetical protein QM627_12785 [Luteolibacter sp.]